MASGAMGHQAGQTPGCDLAAAEEYYSAFTATTPYLAGDHDYQDIPATAVPHTHPQSWGDGYYANTEFSAALDAPALGFAYDDNSYNAPFANGSAGFSPSYASSTADSSTTTQQWGSMAMSPVTMQSPDGFAARYNPSAIGLDSPDPTNEPSRPKRKPAADDSRKHAPPPGKNKNGRKPGKPVVAEPKPKKEDRKGGKDPQANSKSKGKKTSASIPTPSSINSPDAAMEVPSNRSYHPAQRRGKEKGRTSLPPSDASHGFGDDRYDEEDDYYDEDDSETGLPTQRERNRMAATKCRAKTKAAINQLEEDEREASDRRHTLSSEAAALRSDVLFLRNMVLEHHSCACLDKQNYIRNASKLLGRSGGRNPIWGKDGSGGDWAEYHQPDCDYSHAPLGDRHDIQGTGSDGLGLPDEA